MAESDIRPAVTGGIGGGVGSGIASVTVTYLSLPILAGVILAAGVGAVVGLGLFLRIRE